jgi:hypothetical protein
VKAINEQLSNVKFSIVDQKKRIDIHEFQVTELEKAKKLRDRSSSAEKDKTQTPGDTAKP